MKRRARGFTLVEMVVAIAIGVIVLIFATMFIAAPVDAYEAQARRNALVADVTAAWPRLEADLRAALPNSARVRRNGNFVALELLQVVDVARYKTAMGATFTTAGVFRGIGLPFNSNAFYLSVNNLGTAGADAYAPGGSMTAAGSALQITGGGAGEAIVTVTPAPAFSADSPGRRVYLVSGPLTYLCDQGQGTLRRYGGYALAASQAARDSPAELTGAGAGSELVAQGLTTCNFAVSPVGMPRSQTVALRLTGTRAGETVALLHTGRAEYLP